MTNRILTEALYQQVVEALEQITKAAGDSIASGVVAGHLDSADDNARAALAALSTAPQAVPPGWKLVPIEPTPEMLLLASDVDGQSSKLSRAIYRAMLEAAPKPEPAKRMVNMAEIEQSCISNAALTCLGAIKQAYRLFPAQGKTVDDFDKCAWAAVAKAVQYTVDLTAREVRGPVWPYIAEPEPAIAQPATPNIKLVPIRQLFDAQGNQVCDNGDETCHFYVPPIGAYGASCNHCQRGIPNNRPHRLCPVIHESNK